jgi:hypothetical protein
MLISILKKALVLLDSKFNVNKLHIYRRPSGYIMHCGTELLTLLKGLLP